MEKTIKIGEKEVKLSNNIGWTMEYRDQFNHDIIPTLMPMLAGFLSLAAGVVEQTGKDGDIGVKDILAAADSDAMDEAIVKLSGLEFVEVVNITWALAKCADPEIPEPRVWVRDFDTFPVDEVLPAVLGLILKGTTSTKNWRRLQEAMSKLKPEASTSTELSSQESSEA